MKINRYAVTFVLLALSACSDTVPTIDDPHHIVVNGERMTQAQFLEKYCGDKSDNRTCIEVGQAMRKDSTRGEMPKW